MALPLTLNHTCSNMKRAFDPITNTFLLFVAGLVAMGVYARTKNKAFIYAAVAAFVWAGIRLMAISKNKGGKYSAKVYNNSDNSVCVQSEFAGVFSISPGMSVDANTIKTLKHSDKAYKLRNGTVVYVGKNGNVKAYSPISAAINPGWKDRSYFEKEGALEQWESLFNCN